MFPLSQPEVKMEEDSPTFLSPSLSLDSPFYEIQRPLTLHCKLLENPDSSIPREDCYRELTRYLRTPPCQPPHLGHDPDDCSKRVAMDTLIAHLPILIPDMTRIFNNELSHKESFLLLLLEFCQLLFADPVAIIKTLFLRNSGANNFVVTFRILLNVESLRVKEQGVKVLLRMLETYVESGKTEDDSVPSILDLMLNADLDHWLVKCLHLNEKPLFNEVIRVFLVLMTSRRDFPVERALHALDESLRVTHLTICDEGLDRDTYFKFIWTAFRILELHGSLHVSFELRVFALFQSLLFGPTDLEYPVVHFGEFVRKAQHPDLLLSITQFYNKLMTDGSVRILITLLDGPVMLLPLAQHLLSSVSFLKSLEEGIEMRDKALPIKDSLDAYDMIRILLTAIHCPGYPLTFQKSIENGMISWKLSRLSFMLNSPEPIISCAWITMVKFFIALLKTDFKSPLLQIVEVESEESTDRLRNPLNQIVTALQNLGLRMELRKEEDELIWESLLEHHKYTLRRRDASFCGSSPPFYKDHLFRKSTQYFLRSYLARNPATEVPLTCLEFLQDYVTLLEKEFILDGRSDGVKLVVWNSIRRLLDVTADWLSRDDPGVESNNSDEGQTGRNVLVVGIISKISHFGRNQRTF